MEGSCGEHPLGTHIVGAGFDLLVQLVLVFIPEGWVAHQQNIQDHAWGESKAPASGQGRPDCVLPSAGLPKAPLPKAATSLHQRPGPGFSPAPSRLPSWENPSCSAGALLLALPWEAFVYQSQIHVVTFKVPKENRGVCSALRGSRCPAPVESPGQAPQPYSAPGILREGA